MFVRHCSEHFGHSKDLGFDVDVFFLDTNFLDAKPPPEDFKRSAERLGSSWISLLVLQHLANLF